jgi:hypothetical protein
VLVEGVDGEGQIEATVERLALLLEGLHVAHRRSAKEQARLRVAAGAVQKGTQRAGQGREERTSSENSSSTSSVGVSEARVARSSRASSQVAYGRWAGSAQARRE